MCDREGQDWSELVAATAALGNRAPDIGRAQGQLVAKTLLSLPPKPSGTEQGWGWREISYLELGANHREPLGDFHPVYSPSPQSSPP